MFRSRPEHPTAPNIQSGFHRSRHPLSRPPLPSGINRSPLPVPLGALPTHPVISGILTSSAAHLFCPKQLLCSQVLVNSKAVCCALPRAIEGQPPLDTAKYCTHALLALARCFDEAKTTFLDLAKPFDLSIFLW